MKHTIEINDRQLEIILDLLTPGKLWEEIEQKQNNAVAIFAGAIALGLAIIVAAAIHG